MPGLGYVGEMYEGGELGFTEAVGPPPANTVLPKITGTAEEGKLLTAVAGTWTNSPTSFSLQWLRCDGAGANPVPIVGETGQFYLLTAADVNRTIRVEETARNAGGSASATSAQTALVVASTAPPPPPPPPLSLSPLPVMRLSVLIQTPDGFTQRWGADDPDPLFVPKDLTFTTTMPGGFERFNCVLERDPRITYRDLVEMSTITVMGPGGAIAWQGRLEKLPSTSGFEAQVAPEGVGWQAHLEDDQSVREIYIDQELSRWEGPSTVRKIALLNANQDVEDASVAAAPGSNLPALVTQITGGWERGRFSEGWYDAKGISIGLVSFGWQLQGARTIGVSDPTIDTKWQWVVVLGTDELPTLWESSPSQRGAGPTGAGVIEAKGAAKTWALAQLFYNGPSAGAVEGILFPVFWTFLLVFGTHGLPLFGTPQGEGLRASAVVGHAVNRWAPKLATVINPSGFPVPQLAFLEPTTVAEVIKQATRFELQDWAVWEGPTFYMNERGERGRKWRARVVSSQLQETGPQVSRLWNGVVVQYQDVIGRQRSVGPEQDSTLLDPDPENPLNQAGVRKWAALKMGTSTPEGAAKVGRTFLRESKQYDTSGQATLVGHVQESTGVLWPVWMVRAGDTIEFVDSSHTGPRRVISTSYSHSSRSNAIQLDQPPDSLTALLERLSVSLVNLGLS